MSGTGPSELLVDEQFLPSDVAISCTQDAWRICDGTTLKGYAQLPHFSSQSWPYSASFHTTPAVPHAASVPACAAGTSSRSISATAWPLTRQSRPRRTPGEAAAAAQRVGGIDSPSSTAMTARSALISLRGAAWRRMWLQPFFEKKELPPAWPTCGGATWPV